MKHTTQYLYNINPSKFSNMPYSQALQFKIDSAKKLIDDLQRVHYTQRDDERLNATYRAISFNYRLLEELSS